MGIMRETAKKAGRALGSVHAGTEKLAASELGDEDNAVLEVTSPDFHVGDPLPRGATAEGEGIPPRIVWKGVPEEARSVALVCEDPDAPTPEPFVHWMVYGLPGSDGTVDAQEARRAREGKNSTMRSGFTPAAPPPGHGTHHYHFQVFALDRELELPEGAGRTELFDAMRGHVVAWGDLVGTHERR